MNIRPLELLTKEELIEIIRHERHDTQPNGGIPLLDYFAAKAMQGLLSNPAGPVQSNNMSGWSFTNCTTDDVADLAYTLADAMLAATPTVKESLTVEPTDSEMLDWLIKENCSVLKLPLRPFIYEYRVFDFHGDVISVGDTAREAITKAMRGEE